MTQFAGVDVVMAAGRETRLFEIDRLELLLYIYSLRLLNIFHRRTMIYLSSGPELKGGEYRSEGQRR